MSSKELNKAVGGLHRSQDGLAPAVRAEQDRRKARSRDRERIGFSILSGVANVILVLIVAGQTWALAHQPRDYFALDGGRLIPMVPMSTPYRSSADVVSFARTTVERSFTLDFNNYRANLEDVRSRFTRNGFASYIESLKASGMLNTLEKRMNLTSSAGVGVLVEEGEEDGSYVWVVRFPLTLKFVGQSSELPEQRLLATVRVNRIATAESVEGIGVAQIVTKPQ